MKDQTNHLQTELIKDLSREVVSLLRENRRLKEQGEIKSGGLCSAHQTPQPATCNICAAPPVSFPAHSDDEKRAFEDWAQGEGFLMSQHPLYYLFLDQTTNTARQGWNAALRWSKGR